MGLFMVLATVMVAAALAFVIVPLRRRARGLASDTSVRRLRALDEALAAGVISREEFATKRAAIANTGAAVTGAAAAPSRSAFTTLLLVAVLLPAMALLLYQLVGTPQALDPANLKAEAAAAHGDRGPEMEQAIAALISRLKDHPDDLEGWALLGRAYQSTNRPDEALAAFKHAHEQAPDALKADSNNQRALWLLGISDYQAGHFDAAIARWNTLLPLLAADSDVAQSVKKQIAEAQKQRDGGSVSAPATVDASASPTPSAAAEQGAAAPHLTVTVSLDPKLTGKLDPEATLFVYARAAKGPPMPLAIQRLKASQLPLTTTLDDSMGMLPNLKLSMFPQIVVGARISKSGNAMAQSGDLQILSAPLDVHRSEPIALRIDQVVP